MTLETRVNNLATAIGLDIKAARLRDGDLATLSTTAKTNLVAAINELAAAIASGATILDTAGDGVTNKTWSADKIYDEITAAKAQVKLDLTAGASAALDTFAEVAAQLAADESAAAALATAVANRVRYDAAQSLTAPQQLQACNNIGVGNPDADFTATYTAAKA
jgi:hypothetical protein